MPTNSKKQQPMLGFAVAYRQGKDI